MVRAAWTLRFAPLRDCSARNVLERATSSIENITTHEISRRHLE
jgi:hypothetical protein